MESKGLYLEIISIKEDKQLDCITECNRNDDCYNIGRLDTGTTNANGIKLSHAYLIVHNISKESITIDPDYFIAIDNNGFSHKSRDLRCDYYARKDSFELDRYDLPSDSKVKFLVLFMASSISKIIYDYLINNQ